MFQSLTQNLTKIFDRLKNGGVLTENQIGEAMREMRIALLEADVALPVVKDFIEAVKIKALGQEVIKSISPGQLIIKIVHDEIISILSSPSDQVKLNLNHVPPINIMMVGLQGSGKTTASAKLALNLKDQNKKVLLVSLDTYRPAAQEQLEILASSIGVPSLPIIQNENPLEITNRSTLEPKLSGYDIVIYDSAGRLHIDLEMIDELNKVKNILNPAESLLVVDSMIGQDAIAIATNFNEKFGISGVILTRIDGDSRGGAALSIKYITHKPIKFLSSGENLTSFETFIPERIASRILDKGDIVSLVEKAASILGKNHIEEATKKLKKGKFDFNDYLFQLESINKMGGINNIFSMLPGMSQLSDKLQESNLNDKIFTHQKAIILSMTNFEKKNPESLNASRKRRIAARSGTSVQQINVLEKQFRQISDLMKKANKMNPKALLRSGIDKFFK